MSMAPRPRRAVQEERAPDASAMPYGTLYAFPCQSDCTVTLLAAFDRPAFRYQQACFVLICVRLVGGL
jgi:hypothetical protein